MTPEKPNPVLLIVSDRPFVWVGFRAPEREVRRWIGERDSDEERALPSNFAGDPADPETYRWSHASSDLSAVIDLHDHERAAGAIDALRRVRPGAAVLVITANDEVDESNIALARSLAWTDALRGDLEGELRQLETLRRLNELRQFAEGDGDVPILLHPDPDPDALASALAIRALVHRDPGSTPIITTGGITRPENRRMADLLHLHVTTVTKDEIRKLPRIIAVDFTPTFFDDVTDGPRLAVIDHHPLEHVPPAEFLDVRPQFGATATMMSEYLRLEDERRVGETLATALLYGIKTDTDSLSRGTSPADVEAYAFLQGRADLTLLRKLERPAYTTETAKLYGAALSNLATRGDVVAAFLGELPAEDAHALADIADFCLGLDEMTWAIAGAVIDGRLILTIRHLGGGEGAGKLAQQLSEDCGSGGGHASMARAVLRLEGEWAALRGLDIGEATIRLADRIAAEVEELRVSLRSSRPARPETIPTSAH